MISVLKREYELAIESIVWYLAVLIDIKQMSQQAMLSSVNKEKLKICCNT